jgi:hypothetical protein
MAKEVVQYEVGSIEDFAVLKFVNLLVPQTQSICKRPTSGLGG